MLQEASTPSNHGKTFVLCGKQSLPMGWFFKASICLVDFGLREYFPFFKSLYNARIGTLSIWHSEHQSKKLVILSVLPQLRLYDVTDPGDNGGLALVLLYFFKTLRTTEDSSRPRSAISALHRIKRKQGTLCCILFSSQFPMILRPENGHFLPVGHRYIHHGIMDGEALEGADLKKETRTFTI
jgi:hypothetical protein